MATNPTTSEPTPAPPAAPPDPGIIAGTLAIGYVPLVGEQAEKAVRDGMRHLTVKVPFGHLATLKILLPTESQDIIISAYGADEISRIVDALMNDLRGMR